MRIRNLKPIALGPYLVTSEGEELFPKAVAVLLSPLVRQKLLDLVSALQELGPVSPDGVGRVSQLHFGRISGRRVSLTEES